MERKHQPRAPFRGLIQGGTQLSDLMRSGPPPFAWRCLKSLPERCGEMRKAAEAVSDCDVAHRKPGPAAIAQFLRSHLQARLADEFARRGLLRRKDLVKSAYRYPDRFGERDPIELGITESVPNDRLRAKQKEPGRGFQLDRAGRDAGKCCRKQIGQKVGELIVQRSVRVSGVLAEAQDALADQLSEGGGSIDPLAKRQLRIGDAEQQ